MIVGFPRWNAILLPHLGGRSLFTLCCESQQLKLVRAYFEQIFDNFKEFHMFMRIYFWHYFNFSHNQTLSPIYVAAIWWEYIFYASMPHSMNSWGEFWKRMCNDEKSDQLRCMWLVSIFSIFFSAFFFLTLSLLHLILFLSLPLFPLFFFINFKHTFSCGALKVKVFSRQRWTQNKSI